MDQAASTDWEVLIVGGGINGAGMLRDLALQGVRTLLVTKGDFSEGASAASSRMIHGGLRYLEQAEFRLVRESLAERNGLLLTAPHYVRPLRTTIPVFTWTGGLWEAVLKLFRIGVKTGRRGALWVKLGLSFYDFYVRHQRLVPKHSFESAKKALRRMPGLSPLIVCTATYFDAWITHPERLCHELVSDARAAAPSSTTALNYVAATGIQNGAVALRCQVTGRTFAVRPKILINAGGPWIDEVNSALGESSAFIGGTKGSHLVLDYPELHRALDGQVLYENPDARVCLVFPFHDKVIVGSTDIPVRSPEDAICDESEIEYILDSVRQILPGFQFHRSQIVAKFSGVRPLPRSNASTPGQVSRDHSCQVLPPSTDRAFPIFSLVGGKWTTFRAFSEQVSDRALEYLGKRRLRSTEGLAIGGGLNFPGDAPSLRHWIQAEPALGSLTQERQTDLVARYGTRSIEVARFLSAGDDTPLTSLPDYTKREITFLCQTEDVVRLDDLLLRCTSIALLGELTQPALIELANIAATALDWDSHREEEELHRTETKLAHVYGIHFHKQPKP